MDVKKEVDKKIVSSVKNSNLDDSGKFSKRGVEYHEADKLRWSDFKKTLPIELVPTERLEYIFGGIFLLVIIIGFITFPFSSLLSGNVDLQIKIGLPWAFFIFDLGNPEGLPLKIGALVLDLLIYLVLAYAVDVAVNVFMRNSAKTGLKTWNKKMVAQPKEYKIDSAKVKSSKIKSDVKNV